jgi:TPR repeat protein
MKKDKRKKKKTKVKTPKRSEYVTFLRELSENGDPDACFHLGLLYMRGEEVKNNPQKAFECFQKAAAGGVPEAMLMLGTYYITGEAGERNLDQAKLWLSQAAALGVEEARETLRSLEADYDGITQEIAKVEDFKKKYAQGDGDAALELYHYYKDIYNEKEAHFYLNEAYRLNSGNLYLEMGDGAFNKGETETAIKFYRQALDIGKKEAYIPLASTLYNYDYSEEAKKEAWDLMQKARAAGEKNASCYLAMWLYDESVNEDEFKCVLAYVQEGLEAVDDEGVLGDLIQKFYVEKIYDDETIFKLSKALADRGDSNSVSRVAYMYLKGEGVKKDLKQATHYLKIAEDNYDFSEKWLLKILESHPRNLVKAIDNYAKSASEDEIYEIAKCYLEGVAVDQDSKKGLHYLEEAAQDSFDPAISLLGEIYLRGYYGVHKDEEKGVQMLLEAAEMENPRALSVLSRCYDNGVGVEQDGEISYRYYQQFRNLIDDEFPDLLNEE